ncbi:MAG: rhodanese-like domain-containing protein [Flavobacteriales bacterium]|jgi:rhodanese-related sulfurtransferase|tara:strand:- start:1808 stop:2311 length:504 start_codon:yes stop_codon:yes gene_type:complete
MKLKITYILAFFLAAQIGTAQESLNEVLKKYHKNAIPYISATELRIHQSKNDVIILDSREFNEYQVSHIKAAISVGYNTFSMETVFDTIKNKETPIVVYCTIGIRSEMIAAKLQKAGYINVKNLYGGICEWKNKEYKVIDSTQKNTNNIHTYSKEWSTWLLNGNPIY